MSDYQYMLQALRNIADLNPNATNAKAEVKKAIRLANEALEVRSASVVMNSSSIGHD